MFMYVGVTYFVCHLRACVRALPDSLVTIAVRTLEDEIIPYALNSAFLYIHGSRNNTQTYTRLKLILYHNEVLTYSLCYYLLLLLVNKSQFWFLWREKNSASSI